MHFRRTGDFHAAPVVKEHNEGNDSTELENLLPRGKSNGKKISSGLVPTVPETPMES